jgi:hypothetical protein
MVIICWRKSRLQEINLFHQLKVSSSLILALFRKIVSYILVTTDSSSADIAIGRETTTALESVFPQSELPIFISLNPNEKEKQIEGLCHLVTGIRLLNKNIGKGGVGLEDSKIIVFNQSTSIMQ